MAFQGLSLYINRIQSWTRHYLRSPPIPPCFHERLLLTLDKLPFTTLWQSLEKKTVIKIYLGIESILQGEKQKEMRGHHVNSIGTSHHCGGREEGWKRE